LGLTGRQKLSVSFQVRNQASQKAFRPKQVFLRIFDTASFNHYIVCKLDNQNFFVASLVASSLSGVSGEYFFEVIVADPNAQNQIQWQFAAVELTLKDSAVVGTPFSKQVLLPEIHHEFRAPEKRPNPVISLFFSGLVAVPLLFLFVGWIRVGFNFLNFPVSGTGFLCAIGFHGCLISILLLFVFYWLKLTMFETLGYLGLLTIPTIVLGQQTLRNVYLANLPKTKTQ